MEEDAVQPTTRSKVLGWYFRFKAVTWAAAGIVLLYAALTGGSLDDAGPMRLIAFFTLMFAVPSVLLWTLGILIKMRLPIAWWIGLIYAAAVVGAKTVLGTGELPGQAWYWLSSHVPPTHLVSLRILAVAAILVYAMDVAVFVALLSPRGRDCFDIGKPNPSARP